MMRQTGKQRLTIATLAGLAVGLLLVVAASAQAVKRLSNQYVTNPLTGVAMEGMDVVSYFTEPAPSPGSPGYAYDWDGVTWYFASDANREVFASAPDVYAPAFGGHGVAGLARGFLTDGNPRIFVLRHNKLMFFYSAGNYQAYLAAPDAMLARAAANWETLSAELVSN